MIGIFGGTFDPIHYGHLRPALEVKQALGLDQVRFVPLAIAVHRSQPAASAALRLAMVRAAIANTPAFVADDREIRRHAGSYTLDTLTEIAREEPERRLILCLGADAFGEFLTWHRPLDILDLAHLVVMRRPQTSRTMDPGLERLVTARAAAFPRELRSARAGRIYFQPVTQLDISATAIRDLIAGGRDPRFLLPDRVLDLIRLHGLYN